jgi:plastocyanin
MFTKHSGRNLINAFALAMLVATTSASGIGPADAQQANSVVMKNFDFSPMSLTVKAGESVTWKNLDGEPHTVTSVDGLFRSGALDQNESFTFKFDKPGTYKYLCSIHPRMMAAIIVQ